MLCINNQTFQSAMTSTIMHHILLFGVGHKATSLDVYFRKKTVVFVDRSFHTQMNDVTQFSPCISIQLHLLFCLCWRTVVDLVSRSIKCFALKEFVEVKKIGGNEKNFQGLAISTTTNERRQWGFVESCRFLCPYTLEKFTQLRAVFNCNRKD